MLEILRSGWGWLGDREWRRRRRRKGVEKVKWWTNWRGGEWVTRRYDMKIH